MAEISLQDGNGNPLQIAAGVAATLAFRYTEQRQQCEPG